MEKTLRQTAIKISKEAAFILLTVAGAIILPQILHGLGALLGVGGKLGSIFLPMYLPVLIIGFYRGPIPGAIVGIMAPIISYAITGMPVVSLLPYITLELVALGALSGIFAGLKLHAPIRVALAQIVAKVIRLTAFAIVLLIARGTLSGLFAGVLLSIPGAAIQLVLVSSLLMKKEKENNEE